MESKAKLLGHPIHQMIIVFPLGLLPTSLGLDLVTAINKDSKWSEFAFWLIAAGVVSGLVAAVFGLIDLLAIPPNTRAKSIGTLHGVGNVIVVGLFIVGWFLRRPHPGDPGALAIALSFIGIALALVTGWLGGELVDRLGVGVSPGAHVNAPSSLSGKPASEPSQPLVR